MTMIAVYKKFFLMLGVTVLLCLSASVVWSEQKLIPLKMNIYSKFSDKPNGKVQYVYTGSDWSLPLYLQKFLEIKEKYNKRYQIRLYGDSVILYEILHLRSYL